MSTSEATTTIPDQAKNPGAKNIARNAKIVGGAPVSEAFIPTIAAPSKHSATPSLPAK